MAKINKQKKKKVVSKLGKKLPFLLDVFCWLMLLVVCFCLYITHISGGLLLCIYEIVFIVFIDLVIDIFERINK